MEMFRKAGLSIFGAVVCISAGTTLAHDTTSDKDNITKTYDFNDFDKIKLKEDIITKQPIQYNNSIVILGR